MSTLSGSSTDAEVWQSYDDNASFEEDGSATKAAAFVTACRILLRRRPNAMAVDGESVAFDGALIARDMERARNWLASNRSASGNGVRHLDFSRLRD